MKSAVRKIINEILLIVVYVFMLILCLYLNRNGESTGLYINITMFAVVFIIFAWAIVWSFMKVNKISEDFKRAAKKIRDDCRSASDSTRDQEDEDYFDDGLLWEVYKDDGEGLFRQSNLRDAYTEYIEEMKRLESISPSGYRCSIEDYINQDLIDSIAHKNLLNLIPGAMTGMGILGTFVGLSIGLQNFNTGTSTEIEESIAPLMEGIKVAFHTSIYGMVFSLVFNLVYRNVLEDCYDSMEKFLDAFLKYVCPDNENEGLSKLIDSQQKQSDAVVNPILTAVRSMDRNIAEMLALQKEQYEEFKRWPQVMGDSVGRQVDLVITPQLAAVNNNLKSFAANVSKNQMTGMGELIDQFTANMNQSLADSFANLSRTIDETCVMQRQNSDYMKSVLNEASGMTYEIRQINELSGKSVESMSKYVQDMENLQSAINQSFVSQNLQMDQNHRIEEKQLEYIENLVEYEKKVSESSEKFSSNMSEQVQLITRLDDEFRNKLLNQMDILAEKAQEQNTALGEAARQEIQSISELSTGTTSDIERAARELGEASKQLTENMQKSLTDTFDVFDRELAVISRHLSGTIADIDDTTERVPKVVNTAYKKMEEAFNEMHGQMMTMIRNNEIIQANMEALEKIVREKTELKTDGEESAESI